MRRFVTILLTFSMLLLCIAPISQAESAVESPVYLALGDSITTGYGLAEGEKGFADIVAEQHGYTLINRAINGNTAAGILQQLKEPAVLADVAAADVITITCGGNDLMGVLYGEIAAIYNSALPAMLAISDGDVAAFMSTPGDPRQQALLLAAKTVLEGNVELGVAPFTQGEALKSALMTYAQNMTAILTGIRMVNPDVTIILATQYNPYAIFSGVYASLADGMNEGAQLLSKAIGDYSLLLGYRVADVYSAFAASEENLCNASMEPLNLDFHPNAAGHAVIAQCVWAVLDAE